MTDKIDLLARLAGWPAAAIATLLLVTIGSPLNAQDSDGTQETIDEIVVTGSRLKRRDFTSPSPIATIDRDTLLNSGQGTLEASLNQMPQVIPDFDRTSNNPGNGTARVNLRGFGSNRTLVLLNGRRLAPSGVGTSIDVNNLPQVLMERVEVITGGASTVYGSDAVAGVVNFITQQNFDGFGLDASVYATAESDSEIFDLNAAYGHNFANGQGNITLFGGFYDRNPSFAGDREFTATPYIDRWFADGSVIEGGSTAVPAGMVPGPPADLGNGPVQVTFTPDGIPVEFSDPEDRYNYAPLNYLQTPLERYSGGMFLNYDLTDKLETYVELTHTINKSQQSLAPVPLFATMVTNTDNPGLTPEAQQVFANNFIPVGPNLVLFGFRYRIEDLGPRIVDYTRNYSRVAAGLRGDLNENWDFDIWLTYTKGDEEGLLRNDASRSRFQQGMLVDPATGQCFDPSNGCAAVNPFGEGRLSADGLAFIAYPPLVNETSREQKLISGFVRGSPFRTWAGALDVAFGAEWRTDNGDFQADDALFSGDALGFRGTASVDGTESVSEVYVEALVPLADSAAFAESLNLELGVRYSNYQHAGALNTYKIGGDWVPVHGIRFRAMFQHSARAPNLLEAFQEQFVVNGEYVNVDPTEDPCTASADPVGNGNVDKCIATGLPLDQIGIFEANVGFPTAILQGGNPELTPEEADTYTVGVVLSPEKLANWQISVDYFDLRIEDTIGALVPTVVCFDPLNSANLFCDTFGRDPNTFDVNEMVQAQVNRGGQQTRGFDTLVNYQTDLPAGLAIGGDYATLSVDLIWTHVLENTIQAVAGGTAIDCAGRFGWPCWDAASGQTFPEDRMTAHFNYLSGDFITYLTWRWIAGTENAAEIGAPFAGVTDPMVGVPTIGDKNYVDLGFGYQFSDNVTARLTVANLLNTDPPFMADAVVSNNTDTTMYDIFGRSYSLSMSLRY